ncbi:helix-turn-helix domain-containing protein [Kineococcus glutinatus]|uniref:helix-turn-helix domain-containing protein n=1 Tax=Kineococcus glutinatus TaxID=1070872 RepID=UPI0031EF08D9
MTDHDGTAPGAGGWATPPLAERLQHLFEHHVNPRTQRRWTLRQVKDAVNAQGVTLSLSYLLQLRRGERDDPTLHQLTALARVFGVPPGYFVGDEETAARSEEVAQLEQAVQAHPEVRVWAERSLGMSPRDIHMITAMIDVTAEEGGSGRARRGGARHDDPA